MSAVTSGRNLLFGLLALQNDFLTREQLLEAVNAWLARKHQPLADVLQARGLITAEDARLVEGLVARQLRRCGDDTALSLAAVRSGALVRDELARADDAEVRDSAASLVGDTVDHLAGLSPAAAAGGAMRYRKLRFHARGGLGEVSVARDEELGREVALKEIQDRFADWREYRARFVREAEITGNLEHPGIVPVYGLASGPDGRPYYAMRFIKGESLQEAIARFHKADQGRRDPGERELALRGLLGRFVAVCNAVTYAHSRGVVHRDLKPANVMLGEYGETLVVDWGLAKVTGQPDDVTAAGGAVPTTAGASATEMGQAVGTPAYMPPEQARGQLDQVGPPSDVFALGATLYCLLAGRPPVARGGEPSLVTAAEAEPTPARRVNPRVPPALEAVCARALAARPDGRYQSARLLAADVERYLADEPVTAMPEPAGERARRWVKRNRTLVSAGVALLLAGLAGLGAGLYAVNAQKQKTLAALGESQENLARAVTAEAQAKADQARAETNLGRAEKAEAAATRSLGEARANLALARQAVDECFGVARDHPLLTGTQVSRPMRALRRLLLEKALPFYENFRDQRPRDPEARLAAARHLRRVADIHAELGDSRAALARYQQIEGQLRRLVGEHPEVADFRGERALALSGVGDGFAALNQPREAMESYREAVGIFRRLPASTREAVHIQYGLAVALNNMARLESEAGRDAGAVAGFREVIDLGRRLLEARPNDRSYRELLAQALMNLGYATPGQSARAAKRDLLEQAIEQFRRLDRDYPRVPDYQGGLAFALFHLGNLQGAMGQGGQALRSHAESARLGREVVVAHPDLPVLRLRLAQSLNNLAVTYGLVGQRARQLRALAESAEQYRELARSLPDQPRYAHAAAGQFYTLARLHHTARSHEPARQAADEAVAWYEAAVAAGLKLSPDSPYARGLVHWSRATVLDALRLHLEAVADWDQAVLRVQPHERNYARLGRAASLAHAGAHDRAAAEAGLLSGSPAMPPGAAYDAACVFALAGAAALADPNYPLPIRERLAEARARRAVALLAQAASAGFFRAPARRARLDRDPDLGSLRDREDYRRFRAALGAAAN